MITNLISLGWILKAVKLYEISFQAIILKKQNKSMKMSSVKIMKKKVPILKKNENKNK